MFAQRWRTCFVGRIVGLKTAFAIRFLIPFVPGSPSHIEWLVFVKSYIHERTCLVHSIKLMRQSIYFAGRESEVLHHAAPILGSSLADRFHVAVEQPDSIFQKAQPADLVVVYSEHFDRFRNLIRSMKSRRVATLYMIDGILEWRNAWENLPQEPACPFTMRPVLSDKAACIGLGQFLVLAQWGNENQLELVGVPRLDPLVEAYRVRLASQQVSLVEKTDFRILVSTAKCPGFTPQQVSTTLESLRNLKAWLASEERFQDCEVVWRLTGDLATELNVENAISQPLLKQLEETDLVITTPSTLMLEAMLMGLPVVLLNYHACPVFVPSAWQIASKDQMQPTFESLLDKASYRRRMHFQNSILHRELAVGRSGDATSRFCELADRMLEKAKVQTSAGESPLEFSSRLLPAGTDDGGAAIPFWHQAAMYPEFNEFENNDYAALQAELAHSRREIDLLHREIDQLKSELQEAHDIFDQIHQHPIAGPVVRIRQKILNWINRHPKSKS